MTNKQSLNLGLVLVSLGVLALLGNLGFFNGFSGLVGSLVLATAGFLFGRIYIGNHRHIWALLIGFGFFAAAVAALATDLSGAYFLAILGSGFAFTYLQHRQHWWAIIPAGVLASLALVVGIEEQLPFFAGVQSSVFFLGIALTFAYLYVAPELKKRWALYPAIGIMILAMLSSSFSGSWFLALILIMTGVYLLKRTKQVS